MVTIRNDYVVIDFYHANKRYRLMTIYKSKELKLANKLMANIKLDLERGKFFLANYKQYIKSPSILAELDAHYEMQKRRKLLGDLIIDQLARYEKRYQDGIIAESTYRMYKGIINTRLMPTFKDIELVDVTTYDLDEYISGIQLSRNRINFILAPLREIFRRAKKQGVIATNPFDNLDNIDITHYAINSEYTPEPFNSSERQLIIDTAEGQLKNIIQFAFWTGMRISEIFALEWGDIDFKREIISVTKSKSLGKIKSPKTKSGIREVEITTLAFESLNNQKQYTFESHGVIFHNPMTHMPWSKPDAFRRHWIKILSKANVRYRNPHQIRHSFISYLLMLGNRPEVLYRMVGHVNTEMIYKVYGKYIQGEKIGKQLITR